MTTYECDACGDTFDTLSSLRIHQQDVGHVAAGHTKHAADDLRVALTWASPENPPGSAAQAIRGHVRGLRAAGHAVDVYYGDGLAALPERAAEYDLVIWPSNLYNTAQLKAIDAGDTHRHFHLIGVDEPGESLAFQDAIDAADTYSAVDPNPVRFFAKRFDLDPADVAIVPNAPNADVFPPAEPAPEGQGYAFAPKTGAPQKEGGTLAALAEATPNTRYETHASDPRAFEGAPFNLRVRPPVPFSRMPSRYAGAAFVVNPARNEGLPNVAFEAFLSRRAYVSRPSAIGRVQTLPAALVEHAEFGTSAEWFADAYGDEFDTGEHYVSFSEGTADVAVRQLWENEYNGRNRVAEAGREWVETLAERWTWQDVAETMVEVVRDGQ